MFSIFGKNKDDETKERKESGSLLDRLKQSVSKTRSQIAAKVEDLISGEKKIDPELLTKLENLLLAADLGPRTTHQILEAVRQKQHQAAGLSPFRFGARDELIDHDLRAIDEIAELRLPHHQRERIGHAVSELEPQHGILAQRAIEDVEARLVPRDML